MEGPISTGRGRLGTVLADCHVVAAGGVHMGVLAHYIHRLWYRPAHLRDVPVRHDLWRRRLFVDAQVILCHSELSPLSRLWSQEPASYVEEPCEGGQLVQ